MGNSVDKIRILYFLEDRAQEGFVKALVKRIAKEESLSAAALIHDVRSARGGSKIINEFKSFVKDLKAGGPETDLLVVAVDGNCKGHRERKKQLEQYFKSAPHLLDKVVFAVPDPHIERWYILDQKAFKDGVGIDKSPSLPPYKCKRDYYKQLLYQVLKESNVSSILGGAEYAERIVENIGNVNLLERHDPGFKFFTQELRRILRKASKLGVKPEFEINRQAGI